MSDRYYVSEIEGWARSGEGGGAPGLSCMVIDGLVNKRVMATYRTEDYSPHVTNLARRRLVHEQATVEAARLNRDFA